MSKKMSLKGAFLLFSVFFIAASIILTVFYIDNKYMVDITATVTGIVTEYTYDEFGNEQEYKRFIYVDYVIDGQEYNSVKLNYYDITLEVGCEINIVYDMRDPTNIQKSKVSILILVAMYVIAVGTLATGIGLWIKEKIDLKNL